MKAFVKRIASCDPRLVVGAVRRPVVEDEDDAVESIAILNMISSLEAQQSLKEKVVDRYEDFQSSAVY